MPPKIWDITVNHAQTCVLDKRAYLYCSSTSQPKTAVVFNVVGQFMGLLVEHEFIPMDKLSETEKVLFWFLTLYFCPFLLRSDFFLIDFGIRPLPTSW